LHCVAVVPVNAEVGFILEVVHLGGRPHHKGFEKFSVVFVQREPGLAFPERSLHIEDIGDSPDSAVPKLCQGIVIPAPRDDRVKRFIARMDEVRATSK
jgi:hypothetical protein